MALGGTRRRCLTTYATALSSRPSWSGEGPTRTDDLRGLVLALRRPLEATKARHSSGVLRRDGDTARGHGEVLMTDTARPDRGEGGFLPGSCTSTTVPPHHSTHRWHGGAGGDVGKHPPPHPLLQCPFMLGASCQRRAAPGTRTGMPPESHAVCRLGRAQQTVVLESANPGDELGERNGVPGFL